MFTPPAPVFRGTGHPRVECHFLAFRGVWMRYFNSQVSGYSISYYLFGFPWRSASMRSHAIWGISPGPSPAFRHHAQAAGAIEDFKKTSPRAWVKSRAKRRSTSTS